MKKVNLLSSAAVLRALYDNKKDIYDVIAEFIRTAIGKNSIKAFDSFKCTELLLSEFGFSIPEAIVKSCLRNRLKRSEEVEFTDGMYRVTKDFGSNDQLEHDFKSSQENYEKIIAELADYYETRTAQPIDRGRLRSDFEAYLLNPEYVKNSTSFIANFILANENTLGFKDRINQIEEGLILYTGIRYSPDLSTLGHWRSDLTIFLDTEHLFSATDLNGALYKKVFDDFHSLVKEANRKKGKGKLHLKYFDETLEAVERFFRAAERIIENKMPIDPSKTAMLNIVNGCKQPSDVLEKKSKFLEKLSSLSIFQEDSKDYYKIPELNLESETVLAKLKENFQDHKKLEQNDISTVISNILKLFTKVNVIRNGRNNVGIDGITSIFLTENKLTQKISYSEHVFAGNGTIPFATNIEFMTEKLWFKLNKGFGGGANKPISFDAVIRAKLVLSSQVSSSVSDTYKSLLTKYQCQEISDEQLVIMYADLRNIPATPDDINSENLNISTAFLEDDFIEKSLREKSLLEKQSEEGKAAIEELKRIRYQQKKKLLTPLKKKARLRYFALQFFTFLIIPTTLILLTSKLYTQNDTALSIVFGSISIISCLPFVKIKKINLYYWSLSKRKYKKLLARALQWGSR